MPARYRTVVVGSGIFGVTSALELAARGHQVMVMDAGFIPNINAASTDISKIIRMDYGADDFYTRLMLEAFPVWDHWNRSWQEPLYHPDGFLLLTQNTIKPGDWEFDSLRVLEGLGYAPQRINRKKLRSDYPAWNADRYQDGYFNPHAGWAESGRVVEHLSKDARVAGITVRESLFAVRVLTENGVVCGVLGSDGVRYPADTVIIAAGAWSPLLSPRLREVIVHTAQPVFHFRPSAPELFLPPVFPVWAADITKTGWYGFPLNREGILKIGNHGPGQIRHPDDERTTNPEDEVRLRSFLEESLPALAKAPLFSSRICFYSDSWDGDFYIDRDPDEPGLVYATGGS